MATPATTGPQGQYEAAIGGAGLIDRSQRGKLDISGPDAVEYLQGQITNDVEALAPQQGCYAALLNPKGRILSDLRVLVRDPQLLWLDVEPEALETVIKELRTYKIGRKVEIDDRSSERAMLSLLGDGSAGVASSAASIDAPQHEHEWRDATIAGQAVSLVRTALGIDLLMDAPHRNTVTDALFDAGAEPIGEPAAELARIERGLPRYGLDMNDDNLPGEAGITERAVSFTKGCYVGQEPVARMFHKGHPNRVLRGLRLTQPVTSGAGLMLGDRQAGRIGSVGDSPRNGPIALAIVRREAEPGDRLSIEGSDAQATVIELPFGAS